MPYLYVARASPERFPRAKYVAVFYEHRGKPKVVPFGARGAKDFIQWTALKGDQHAAERRANYIARHSGGRENWKDGRSAGALSRFLLWEKKTMEEALAAYAERFDLKRAQLLDVLV